MEERAEQERTASAGSEELEHDHAQARLFGIDRELAFAVLCALALAIGFAIEKLGGASGFAIGSYVASYVFGGWFTLVEALENLRRRRFEIDTLMLVVAAGSAVLGAWPEGALLPFLFGLGHALEHYAMGRAKRAIEALAEWAPEADSGCVGNLGGLRAVAFDKSGTLTEGRPSITDLVAVNGASENDVRATALAAEALSDHPPARAIVRDAKSRLEDAHVPPARDLCSLAARGVIAQLNATPV